jgi:hypothetical protein
MWLARNSDHDNSASNKNSSRPEEPSGILIPSVARLFTDNLGCFASENFCGLYRSASTGIEMENAGSFLHP